MEFKDFTNFNTGKCTADVIRSQLARNPMILVDKLFIRNLSNHVRNSFTGLYSYSFTNNHCVENKAKTHCRNDSAKHQHETNGRRN